MQKTSTFLLFTGDQFGKAEEAMRFYVSLFPGSQVTNVEYFKEGDPGGQPGTVKLASFTLAGLTYRISESSYSHGFTFTPAMSIYVACTTIEEIEDLYARLLIKGAALMPLGDYGFSKKFGWVNDQFGVSWQLNLVV